MAAVALVVLIGGVFFLFGGKDSPIQQIVGNTTPPPATFAFKTVTTGAISTVAQANKAKQMKTAKALTPDVQAAVTQWLQTGYVDPDTWGDAGAIKDLFTGPAVDQVEPNVDTLTFGTTAGDTYTALNPDASHLKVTALVDGDANANRAMADVTFTGKASLNDGTFAKVAVTATMFFVLDGDTWKIESFHVQRAVKPITPKASATASSSPSENA